MTATRRLAAILAAEVVSYSRRTGEDEVGIALGVREHREAARSMARNVAQLYDPLALPLTTFAVATPRSASRRLLPSVLRGKQLVPKKTGTCASRNKR